MNQKENKNNSFLPFLLSLLTHALLILLLVTGIAHLPHAAQPEKTALAEPPPEVTLDLSPLLPEKKASVDINSEHPLTKAPEHAAFESHQNTAAASELAPTGTLSVPTQDGHHDETLELKNQQRAPGDQAHPLEGLLNQPSETMPQSIPTPQPKPDIFQTPPKPASEKATEASTPTSTPTPIATPLALSTPLPAQNKPVMGTLSSAAKAASSESDARSSVIRGSISNKGKASVAAAATPLGRYKKSLSDAISSRWYYYIDDHMELLNFGTTTVSFYVNQQGKVNGLSIVSNTSNQAFADCCIKSIMEAKLPPIPPEIATTLQGEHLEIEYRFTIYTNND